MSDPKRWRILRRVAIGSIAVLFVALLGYLGFVGYEASRRAVAVDESRSTDCGTPSFLYGWSYEAINYDFADDARLQAANPTMKKCASQGAKAGDEVVTDDGIRLAGWYIPSAAGTGPQGPTVIVAHGYAMNKSAILHYAVGLHQSFNLVVFDQRNGGRSTGDKTTIGLLEQKDLHAIIDWVERTKQPSAIGVLGDSQGAVAAINEAVTDERVVSLVLDSMHTRMQYQFERRLELANQPAYPGTWAVFVATWLRTGVWFGSGDAIDALPQLGVRPILLIHGTGDKEDLPPRTQAFYEEALSEGIPAEIQWCQDAGHSSPTNIGMPADYCADDYATWTSDFFTRTLASGTDVAARDGES